MNDKPRVPPIPPRQWSEAARAAIAILSEEASHIGRDPADDRHVHNLPCTQLHHPELMKRYFPFLRFLLREGTLGPRYRELAILRVAWLRQAEYEWTQHVPMGRAAGIADREIRQIAGSVDRRQWDAADGWLIQAVDELLVSARISDQTWNGLMPHLGVQQMIELIHVVGNYDLIAMFMNSTALALEDNPGNTRFEDFVRR